MPAGRPHKLNFDETLLTVVKNLASQPGMTMAKIAHILGISPYTFKRYRDNLEELEAAVREGKSFSDDLAEQALFARAIGYWAQETKVFFHKGKTYK